MNSGIRIGSWSEEKVDSKSGSYGEPDHEFLTFISEKAAAFISKDDPSKKGGVAILLPELKALASIAITGRITVDAVGDKHTVIELNKKAKEAGLVTGDRGFADKQTREALKKFLKHGYADPERDGAYENLGKLSSEVYSQVESKLASKAR
jgi:hypothetical protein